MYSTLQYNVQRHVSASIGHHQVVELKGRLYNVGYGGGDEISSYNIIWGSGLLMLTMLSGYYVVGFGVYI
jgi:hypothetical protein